jgi:hypothetical protein
MSGGISFFDDARGVPHGDTSRYVLTRLGAIGQPGQREWDDVWDSAAPLLGAAAATYGLLFMTLSAALGHCGRGSGPAAHGAARPRPAVVVASYLVSTVHAVVAVAGCLHIIVADAALRRGLLALDHQAAVFGSSALRDGYLLATAGYMLYDAVACAVYHKQLGDRMTYAHHIVVAW